MTQRASASVHSTARIVVFLRLLNSDYSDQSTPAPT